MKKYLIIFFVSGGIITGIVILSRYVSTMLAALLYAVPFEFLIIFFSLNSVEKEKRWWIIL